tara:strand:- start:113 stop:271 length:159 start_codon:yes stop_codon:yes gene_type:complete
MKIKTTVTLDEEVYNEATQLMIENGQKFSGLVRVWLIDYIKEAKDNDKKKNA